MQVDPTSGDHAGGRLTYAYDGTGRLLSRTTLGKVPQGGTDSDRPFIAKRAFVWDGQRLAAETGLNYQDQPIWRQQVAPGQRGLDDAPLVRVETDLQGTPSTKTYALIRDEMGSVLAVTEERAGQSPNLLARYLYAPYGQRHTELGPELVKIEFDASITKVGSTDQTLTAGQTVGGALRIITTSPLAAATLTAGLTIAQYDEGSSSWTTATRTDFAIGTADSDASDLRVMRIQGWAKAIRYRITLLPSLTDGFGRILVLPSGETQGVAVELDLPSDGVTAPDYARSFALAYDNAAGDTLGGAFPGGQTSGFQGAWSDPVTGHGFHRRRWMDRRNLNWLGPDLLGAVDSPDLYRPLGLSPISTSDPLGLYEVDFHYYVVYYMAYLATSDPTLSRRVAFASQFVDDNPTSSPDATLGYQDPEYQHTLRNFHFLDYYGARTRSGRSNSLAMTLVAAAIEDRDDLQLGIALHGFADTFSHQGFTWRIDPINNRTAALNPVPPIGHGEAGHAPDKPYNDPNKAAEAAIEIYDFLLQYAARLGEPQPQVNRDRLREELTAKFKEFSANGAESRATQWYLFLHSLGVPVATYLKDSAPGGTHEDFVSRYYGDLQLQIFRVEQSGGKR